MLINTIIMKRNLPVLLIVLIMVIAACSSAKQTTATANETYTTDQLAGKWTVLSMKRAPKAEKETLEDVTLSFGIDSSFAGKAPCNSMGGLYTLAGNQIRFSHILTTKMACAAIVQEGQYIQLLEKVIRSISIGDNKLLLRDADNNVLIECVKE